MKPNIFLTITDLEENGANGRAFSIKLPKNPTNEDIREYIDTAKDKFNKLAPGKKIDGFGMEIK